jgi:hypothetical protein
VLGTTALFTRIVAAIVTYVTAAITLRGTQYTPQALTALFQDYLQRQRDLDDAHANVAAKQRARDEALAAARAVLPSLRGHVAATYGEESTAYTTFGFTPHKRAVVTTHVKAASATKATTTRKAHQAALKAPVPVPAPQVAAPATAAPQNTPTAPVPPAPVKS